LPSRPAAAESLFRQACAIHLWASRDLAQNARRARSGDPRDYFHVQRLALVEEKWRTPASSNIRSAGGILDGVGLVGVFSAVIRVGYTDDGT